MKSLAIALALVILAFVGFGAMQMVDHFRTSIATHAEKVA